VRRSLGAGILVGVVLRSTRNDWGRIVRNSIAVSGVELADERQQHFGLDTTFVVVKVKPLRDVRIALQIGIPERTEWDPRWDVACSKDGVVIGQSANLGTFLHLLVGGCVQGTVVRTSGSRLSEERGGLLEDVVSVDGRRVGKLRRRIVRMRNIWLATS
jgi:hypothetical protein